MPVIFVLVALMPIIFVLAVLMPTVLMPVTSGDCS